MRRLRDVYRAEADALEVERQQLEVERQQVEQQKTTEQRFVHEMNRMRLKLELAESTLNHETEQVIQTRLTENRWMRWLVDAAQHCWPIGRMADPNGGGWHGRMVPTRFSCSPAAGIADGVLHSVGTGHDVLPSRPQPPKGSWV